MDPESDKKSALVLSAVRKILKPFARLLLANGVTLPALQEMLKQVLVESAIHDFPVKGKMTTDSRISVLTGVHRKDVKRIRSLEEDQANLPASISLGSQVVNTWMTEKRWLDRDKNPLALPRLSTRKGMKSFEGLVESVSKDIRSRAVLDELERTGIVKIRDGYVYLDQEAFIPHQGFEEQLYFLSRGTASHLDASVSNVESVKPVFFDRMVYYDHIPKSALPELMSLAGDEAMQLLKKVNMACRKKNKKQQSDGRKLTIGVYVHHDSFDRSDEKDSKT